MRSRFVNQNGCREPYGYFGDTTLGGSSWGLFPGRTWNYGDVPALTADFTKSYWRHHRLPRPMRSNSDRRIRKLFSNSLWQTITSPAPQPQSKRIAQKGIGLAAWMAIA